MNFNFVEHTQTPVKQVKTKMPRNIRTQFHITGDKTPEVSKENINRSHSMYYKPKILQLSYKEHFKIRQQRGPSKF